MTAPRRTTPETIPFQAETRALLDLVIHSLYTHEEIFLRELISNASDALDKRRVEALRDPALASAEEPAIQLAVDPDARVLCVVDNGVGMSRQEVVDDLGTIARSGTKRFLELLKEARAAGEAADLPQSIGQFGVGFYSAFMVADEVVVETRRAGEEAGTRWSSAGRGEFTVEEVDKPSAGTTITLHLKPRAEGEPDYADEVVLRGLVRRYSDFIQYPIRMELGEGEDRHEEVLNSRRPLWTRPRAEIGAEEHAEFYRHLTHGWGEPLEAIHFRAEGATEYTALLYVPKQRPFAPVDPLDRRSRVSLYVRRVFVMDDCDELLPAWLRFVRGVVESADLPLNVSRETLQHERRMAQIEKRLTRKVLDALAGVLRDRRDEYRAFWNSFGAVLKEGLWGDDVHREEIAGLALFATTAGEEPTTLQEYVERMPVAQREIWVLPAADLATARRSPHLEACAARGLEVLLLADPIDEFVLQRWTEYAGKPLRRIDRGELDLAAGEEREELAAKRKELEPLLESVRKALAEAVADVRFSTRLTESPACLVGGDDDLSEPLRRFLEESGSAVPASKPVLELNAGHPLVARMAELEERDHRRFGEACELLHGQALLSAGATPRDPKRFASLVADLLLRSSDPSA